MKERPILFSGAMVRALLDGSKTQTRRAVKLQVQHDDSWVGGWKIVNKRVTQALLTFNQLGGKPLGSDAAICPYGQPGDRLWVRETFGYVSPDEFERPHAECNIEYRADLPLGCTDRPGSWPVDECAGDPERPAWRPSIHMPRAASRILLEIVSVRVERLHDISETDAIAEGGRFVDFGKNDFGQQHPGWRCDRLPSGPDDAFDSAKWAYANLWESINGAGSWDANPWVWVVEFKRVTT
jgi:hypothetical protein